jgi:hypothetical protein
VCLSYWRLCCCCRVQNLGSESVSYTVHIQGVYFVRHNERTVHLYHELAHLGDQILLYKGDQPILIRVLNEHMSRTGLRVKILSNHHRDMPNGWDLHLGEPIVQDMRAQYEPAYPYMLHAHWRPKNEKRAAFLGTKNWFVQPQCYVEETDEINVAGVGSDMLNNCCAPQPL